MTRFLLKLLRSSRGSGSVEFVLVAPLMLILIFGILDAGRFMWNMNMAEKATQVGARVAIVTSVLAPGLRDEDYAGQTVGGVTLKAGDRIPAAALGTIKCTNSGCVCEAAPCPSSLGTFDSTTFTNVVLARMQSIYPAIQASNVEIRYSGSGNGFAESAASGGGGGGGGGATETMEISPLVTVSLTGLQFTPVTSLVFASIPMPTFSTTLTAEDASGAYSN
jgi:Flp pilus assembly protein TadG